MITLKGGGSFNRGFLPFKPFKFARVDFSFCLLYNFISTFCFSCFQIKGAVCPAIFCFRNLEKVMFIKVQ